MFIRWQKRKRNRPKFGPLGHDLRDEYGADYLRDGRGCLLRVRADTDELDVAWSVILVESVRVDGKPRQRHVAYLGGITESAIQITAQRLYFWEAVLDGLDRLHNRMSIADRRKIEAAIALKVPRLTREEHEASIANITQILGRDWVSKHPENRKPWRPPS
jgi:hypothetical protein